MAKNDTEKKGYVLNRDLYDGTVAKMYSIGDPDYYDELKERNPSHAEHLLKNGFFNEAGAKVVEEADAEPEAEPEAEPTPTDVETQSAEEPEPKADAKAKKSTAKKASGK